MRQPQFPGGSCVISTRSHGGVALDSKVALWRHRRLHGVLAVYPSDVLSRNRIGWQSGEYDRCHALATQRYACACWDVVNTVLSTAAVSARIDESVCASAVSSRVRRSLT